MVDFVHVKNLPHRFSDLFQLNNPFMLHAKPNQLRVKKERKDRDNHGEENSEMQRRPLLDARRSR